MKSFKDFNESGLWDNIRKKKARGEPMRKKGEKGAPTAAAMAKAKGEANEEASVDEAPYVAGEMDIVDSIWNEIRNKMYKDKRGRKMEKHWPFIQMMAKYAGFKVTKKAQEKDKIFRFDIKK